MAHILILIVEDEPGIREQYAAVLRKRGYTVHIARNAEEGLDRLATELPQLIILDEYLPGTDGVHFLKNADLSHHHPGIKVLVATNVDSPEVKRHMLELKVDKFVLKAEFTPYEIADLVDEMLK